MTLKQVNIRLHIPDERVRQYQDAGIITRNLKELSTEEEDRLIQVGLLEELGFSQEDVEQYYDYEKHGYFLKQELLLATKRVRLLDEIHYIEAKVAKIDYLLHEIRQKSRK